MFEQFTVEAVSKLFPDTPAKNIAQNLPLILSAIEEAGGDDRIVLMALGTIRAETESFQPVEEQRSHFNSANAPFDLYDHRADLGNTGGQDGSRFRGRGFVQITGRANYARYGTELGVDLIGRPILACDPAIAAKILARFLMDRKEKILAAIGSGNVEAARRAVNGGLNGLYRFSQTLEQGKVLIEA